ncbi:hypothetical protein D3C85_1020560 [compost metagenome]
MKKHFYIVSILIGSLLSLLFIQSCDKAKTASIPVKKEVPEKTKPTTDPSDLIENPESIDTAFYNNKIRGLSNNDPSGRWPVKTVYPLPGAILPYKRVVAFYGNLFSTRMGILGELPKKQMLKKLQEEVFRWETADSTTPVVPALHYIAVTAQGSNSSSSKYRLRMPFYQIDTIVDWAKSIDGLVFLDIQVGQSTVTEEAATLEKYLQLPNVHLGIDPEFSMKNGEIPNTKIGSYSADEINEIVDFLAKIVRQNQLPPKILVVHRFTQNMITNYKKIKIVPEVQIVINMDGFGNKTLKKSTYRAYIYKEPVQFTGFKLFYKNDTRDNSSGLYTPEELLDFIPIPIYIQYQ